MSLKVLLPWQHTRFQTSPILKAFLATYSVLFSYLQMARENEVREHIPVPYDNLFQSILSFSQLFLV